MKFPFSVEQFLNIFKQYNEAIFPFQTIFYLVAFISIYIVFKKQINGNKFISIVISIFWFWIGIVYHIIFFSSINKAAYFFGSLFIIQGIMFSYYGVVKGSLTFEFNKSTYNYIGIVFLLYALFIYPVLGFMLGHIYPSAPTFGLPCPTTIYTFGMLLFINRKIPLLLLIIPLIWSIIGFGAALKLSIYEDYGLLIAGIISSILLIWKNKTFNSENKKS